MGETAWMSVAFGAGTVIHLLGSVIVLVVVLARVRPLRPDASGPLLWWASLSLGWGLVRPLLNMGASVLASYSGQSYPAVFAALALASIPVDLTLLVLFVRGLLRLAQPPVQALPPPEGYTGPR